MDPVQDGKSPPGQGTPGDARGAGSKGSDLDAGEARRGRGRRGRGAMWRGARLVLGAPVAALSLGQIVENGRLIRRLVADIRRGPPPPRAVPFALDGQLDTKATAFAYGLSEGELLARLARRRRQTAALANLSFGLGCAFVGLWFWRLLEIDGTGLRLLAGLQFAPFCLAFFLAAFQQAHVNWQIRTGRLGSAGDYVRSAEPFWPRA